MKIILPFKKCIQNTLEHFKVAQYIARCTSNDIQYKLVIMLSHCVHTVPKRSNLGTILVIYKFKNYEP